MDTFDTNEEVMSEIDIEATEVDFGENFEYGVNNQENENNNEQEDNKIDGEKGEKNTEDEKLEEKADLLMQSITDKCGATAENSKVEIDRTLSADEMRENILNSGMNLEQQKEELERLDNILANPEEVYMFPDYIIKETEEIKITSIAAMAVDGEGNVRSLIVFVEEIKEKPEEKPINKVDETKVEEATLNLELNIDIDKQEEVDKETLLDQSLLTEIEAINEEEVQQAEEIIQAEEQDFSTSEVHYADVEQVMSVEDTQSELISSEENVSVDNTHYVEQLTVDIKVDAEQVITERIIDLLKEEPQPDFIEETNTVINATETEQTFKDTQERTEPLAITAEDKTEKVQTLEDRIIELLRDEDEPVEIASEQVQTFEVQNTQQEQVTINTDRIIETNTTTETVAEAEIALPYTYTTTERSGVSNEQEEQVVVSTVDLEIQAEVNETTQVSHIESIQEQSTESVEQSFNAEEREVNIIEEIQQEVVVVNKQESNIPSTTEQLITKEVSTDIEVGRSEHVTIEQTHLENIGIVSEINQDRENIIAKPEEAIVNVDTVPPITAEIKPEETTAERIAETAEDKHIASQQVEVSKPIVNETIDVLKETFVNSNQEVAKVVNVNETTEKNTVIEEIKAEEEVIEKVQSSDVVVEAVVNIPEEVNRTQTILSEVVNEVPVAESKEIKSEISETQGVVANNIETQSTAKAETVSYIADSDKIETQNVLSINTENTKQEKADQNKESPIVVKSEEKIVVEIEGREISPKTEKSEKITTERITTERRIQDRKEKPDKITLNNDKDIKIANTKESKVVTKEATPEKVQVLNTKREKEAKVNVLPFKARESKPNSKDVEIKVTKPVAEKTKREAIVLKFNNNIANNTIRNEAPRSLEKPREDKRTTEESLKAKPLSGHEILLQILGISQNATESRNAEPTNSRSIPNTNQEEPETKSIPSIYQQKNLNGITLRIAA